MATLNGVVASRGQRNRNRAAWVVGGQVACVQVKAERSCAGGQRYRARPRIASAHISAGFAHIQPNAEVFVRRIAGAQRKPGGGAFVHRDAIGSNADRRLVAGGDGHFNRGSLLVRPRLANPGRQRSESYGESFGAFVDIVVHDRD